MTRRLLPLALALLAGCAAPAQDAQAVLPESSSPAGAGPVELYHETYDFGRLPPGELKDPFEVPPGTATLRWRVSWISLAPVTPGGAEIKLEDPDGENTLECELASGPVPSAPCEGNLAAPARGTWQLEYEGGGPGLQAEVVVSGGAAS